MLTASKRFRKKRGQPYPVSPRRGTSIGSPGKEEEKEETPPIAAVMYEYLQLKVSDDFSLNTTPFCDNHEVETTLTDLVNDMKLPPTEIVQECAEYTHLEANMAQHDCLTPFGIKKDPFLTQLAPIEEIFPAAPASPKVSPLTDVKPYTSYLAPNTTFLEEIVYPTYFE